MLIDLFIVPKGLMIDETKSERAIKSSTSIVHQYYIATNWRQINNTPKMSFFYTVVYDNEWFDPRLVADLKAFLLYSRGIDMFSLFRVNGEGEVTFQPRVFQSNLYLDPDVTRQPLPRNHKSLKFEKVLGGWLYYD